MTTRPASSIRRLAGRSAVAVAAICTLAVATTPSLASAGTVALHDMHLSGALAWKVSKSLKLRNPTDGALASFTAVAATGPGSAWAFLNVKPVAWHLVSGRWSSVSFPDENIPISYAAASGPDNVWAFGANNTAYRFNGARWTVAHKFGRDDIASVAVISSEDVYVYGFSTTGAVRPLIWRFNGHGWRQLPDGRNLFLVSAVNAHDIWAVNVFSIAHFTDGRWHYLRVRTLLPRKYRTCIRMSAVYAQSASSVWAVDARGCGNTIGPTVLLHYTGRHWHAASATDAIGYVPSTGLIPDGSGGVWLATEADGITSSSLVHFAGGKFTTVRQPVSGAYLAIDALAHAPGSPVSYAVGTVSSQSGGTSRRDHALVLRNS